MKLFRNILSIAVSAAMMCSTAIISPVVSLAAGVLYTLFTESNNPTEPDECYNASVGDYSAGQWRYCSVVKGTTCGFPSSAGNVYKGNFNVTNIEEPYASQTIITGKEYIGFGMQFLTHSNGQWRTDTYSVVGYVDTAAVTVKVNISEISYLDDLYFYLTSRKSGVKSYTAIKLADEYYTESDIGSVKTISIPLKEFAAPDDNSYKINIKEQI